MAPYAVDDPRDRNYAPRQVVLHNRGPHDNSREHHSGEIFAGMEHYLELADKVLKPKHKHDNEGHSR